MQVPFHLTSEIVLLFLGSWLFALAIFFVWRKIGNPLLLYAHVALLILPFFAFAFSLPCSMPWFTSLFQFCSIMWTKLAIYVIPFFILLAILFGYVLLPSFYTYRLNAKEYDPIEIVKYTKKIGIKNLYVYWFDTMEPRAFSIRNAIFISQGMKELLTRKEWEAVLFHELYHVQERSGWKKFSTLLGRFITPLAAFSKHHPHLAREEQLADLFACTLQGTSNYIIRAKRKLESYERETWHA